MPLVWGGISDDDDNDVFSVSNGIEPLGKKSSVVKACATANLVRIGQRFGNSFR